MSQENFDLKKVEIEAIPDNEIKKPNIPIAKAVQEAENLSVWCADDKAALEKAGLDWTLVDDLSIRAGACGYAESIWKKYSKNQKKAKKEWKERSPGGFALRDKLLHDFSHGFRKHPGLLVKLKAIRGGSSQADMLQDLSDLNELGKAQLSLLSAIGFDASKLAEAATLSVELSTLLAMSKGNDPDKQTAKILRDKAYTFMKLAVDEVRTCGKYAFRGDKDRITGYESAYQKRLNQRKRRKNPTNTDVKPEP